MGGEAAYLSLSRGEGGQNLVGPDLGVGLGLVRSQELCAARRLDGGRQFFTRAFDFGFTRSLDETLPALAEGGPSRGRGADRAPLPAAGRRQHLLRHGARRARPAPGRGRHGARRVPRGGRSGGASPASRAEGLTPWQPRTLYRETGWFDDKSATTIVLPTGGDRPADGPLLLTRSRWRAAACTARRTWARLQEPGPARPRRRLGRGRRPARRQGSLRRRRHAPLGAWPPRFPTRRGARRWKGISTDAPTATTEGLRRLSTPDLAWHRAPVVAEALGELRAARSLVRPGDGGTAMLLDEKIVLAEGALAAASGVTLDVLAEREVTAPGESVGGHGERVERRRAAGRRRERRARVSPEGWSAAAAGRRPTGRGREARGVEDRVGVPRERAGRRCPTSCTSRCIGDLYDWSGTPPAVRGEPFAPAPLTARVRLTIAGAAVDIEREASFRLRDEAIGEIRRPVRAVPGPRRRGRAATARLAAGAGRQAARGHAHLERRGAAVRPTRDRGPARLAGAAPLRVLARQAGERAFIAMRVTPPPDLAAGPLSRRGSPPCSTTDRRMSLGIRTIDYGYIPRTPRPEAADVADRRADIRFPPLGARRLRAGRRRPGPGGPARRRRSARGPERARPRRPGDLSRYDAILVGSRAYETDPALPGANGRLLDYARARRAGHRAVPAVRLHPRRLRAVPARHRAPARPRHRRDGAGHGPRSRRARSSATPNAIGPADWDGWVQERGLYFAHTWAPEYTRRCCRWPTPARPAQRAASSSRSVGKGTLRLHGPRLLPPAPRRRPRGVSSAREPARLEIGGPYPAGDRRLDEKTSGCSSC